MSWNADMVTTTGNVIVDLLHNFHLECGARLHKLRVYETLIDPMGREVCGYLLVRGSVHAHAYALALKEVTGVDLDKLLPTPNIPLDKIPECPKYRIRLPSKALHLQPVRLSGDGRDRGAAKAHFRPTRRASSRWSKECPRAARSAI